MDACSSPELSCSARAEAQQPRNAPADRETGNACHNAHDDRLVTPYDHGETSCNRQTNLPGCKRHWAPTPRPEPCPQGDETQDAIRELRPGLDFLAECQ